MAKNYYVLLGVSPKADSDKIKQAYRKIAKTHHPDISQSSNGAEKFKEIKEAYDTLMDADKRKQYDSGLNQGGGAEKIKVKRHPRRRRPEPERRSDDLWHEPSFYKTDRRNPYRNRYHPKKSAEIAVEAVMSPSEAAAGGDFPLPLTIFRNCPVCADSPFHEFFRCPECSGTGKITIPKTITVEFPPNMNHGDRFRISLSNIGIQDMWINIVVMIESRRWFEF